MATIHLMVGFIGFGKTTIAKELEKKLSAVRLTHDEYMVKLYGRNMPYEDFHINYDKVDEVLWDLAQKIIANGTDVIMDYGFWNHKTREKAYNRAKKITDNVVFHNVFCDMQTAKQRILKRSAENQDELYIREDEFDTLAKQYQPWDYMDDYPVVLHNLPNTKYIGQIVYVKIDRPLGSKHPKHGFEYKVNYGFIPYTKSGDGEELDAYVLMEDKPLEEYIGRCIGVVHRTDDDDDKLIVVPEAYDLADESIEEDIAFQEKWFKHILLRDPCVTKAHFGVYGSIIKDDKILLIKKACGPYTGMYDLPGGSQEKGESYADTLKREIKEETGCEVIKAENERHKTIIFSDFTPQSGEKGVLQHEAVLYDVKISGTPRTTGDGLDSGGAVWVKIADLTDENATPYTLIAAGKPLIALAEKVKGDNFWLIAATDAGRAEEFAAIVQRNAEEFKFLPHTSQINTKDKAIEEINNYSEKRRNGEMFFYFIVDEKNKILGCAGVKVKDNNAAEGCYWLDKAQYGKGFAVQAMKLLEKEVFKAGFQRFEIWCNADNLPSVKVPQRLGYKLDRVLSKAEYMFGTYHDVEVFVKIRTDK